MATHIIVPTLGESIAAATVSKWFKRIGEAVMRDEPLVELETDKVTVEVSAPTGGTLESITVAEGAEVEVGSTLGAIADGAAAAANTQAPVAPAKSVPAAVRAAEMIDIAVPSLGESISEGTITKWLKSIGDAVTVDEPLVEIETEKVTTELPSPATGTLTEILAAGGADVEVGRVIARIAPVAVAPTTPRAVAAPAPRPSPTSVAPTPVAAAPLAPAVRKLVDDHGLDPASIPASGRGGRLTKGDVLSFLDAGGAQSAAPPDAAAPIPAPALAPRIPDPRGEEAVRMSKLRQTVARRLKEAQQTAAILSTFNEVDMTAVMKLRSDYRDIFGKKHGVRLGFMSFFVKAAINALREIPAVNGEIYGDEIIYKNYYDIGVAVGGPQGLVVPVLRDADAMSFAAIERTIADLGKRAREGKLTMPELTGGTFTITNGGVFGSLLSTPILNPPQSGILGMHKIQNRPMAVGDKVEVRPMMYLALSYDHRIIDGREAVTFLVRIKDTIEDPQRLLIDA